MTNEINQTAAFFNGNYTTMDQVRISPFDRGFLLGDSIYEAVPAYDGEMLDYERHGQRLLNGLNTVGIESPYTLEGWKEVIEPLIAKDQPAQLLYIQVSRGDEQMRKHRFPVNAKPTVLIFAIPFTVPFDENYLGCAGHLQEDLRWKRCNVKSTSLMGNVLAYHELYSNGVANDEALLVRDGYVVEAPSSNLFMVKDGIIFTPPVDNILPGVTRDLTIDIATAQGMTVREEAPTVDMLKNADEVWVTNSMEELKPVITVDGETIGNGVPGKVWLQLFRSFQALK